MVRLGGVAIFIGNLTALLVWWGGGFSSLAPEQAWEVWVVIIGGIAFFLIGLADNSPLLPIIAICTINHYVLGCHIATQFCLSIASLSSLAVWH